MYKKTETNSKRKYFPGITQNAKKAYFPPLEKICVFIATNVQSESYVTLGNVLYYQQHFIIAVRVHFG